MAKQFRQYEFGDETIVVEEVGRFKLKWYKFLDKFDPVMGWIHPVLLKFGFILGGIFMFVSLGMGLVTDNFWIVLPPATLAGLCTSYPIWDLLVKIRKQYKRKP